MPLGRANHARILNPPILARSGFGSNGARRTRAQHGEAMSSVGNNRLPACPGQANFDPGRYLFGLACPAGQVNFDAQIQTLRLQKETTQNFARAYGARKRFHYVDVEFKNSKYALTFISQVGQANFDSGRQIFRLACPAGRHCFALCFHRC